MTAVGDLLGQLDPDELRDLAERLRPFLESTPTEDDGWIRGAHAIAEYLGCPRSRVYALTSAGRLAVERDGSALIARKSELDAWIRAGGARRP